MTDKISSWSESEEQSVREQLRCVLHSPLFIQAARLGRFLTFVVAETLGGRGQRLNQYAIAIEVFDRDESFDPTVDAIVRVEAGRLRSKLLEYYDEMGRDDPVRIVLPKRSYSATFQFRAAPASSEHPTDLDSRGQDHSYQERLVTSLPKEQIIAVLPFINMSPDPEQEYFADGVTEDLITDLSQLPRISVISRQSTFAYKGTAVTVQQVCTELGANLVLEGSVRKVGERVRITAQLIEGSSGKHMWAQRYDRDVENIFEIQDEVNRQIVSALRLQLSDGEREKLARRGTDVIDAYDYVLRGMKESQANTPEGSARARYCFESALELDPGYAIAYARLAFNYVFRWILDWSKSREDSIDKGFAFARKAVALDDKLALAHAALCWTHLWMGEHDKAITEGQLAIALDPGDVLSLERLALSMMWAGDGHSSLPLLEKAKRLNPGHSYDFPYGVAMFMLGNYAEATEHLQSAFEQSPNFLPAGLYLASSLALGGRQGEAEAAIAKIKQLNPDYMIARDVHMHFKNPEDRTLFVGGLQQAGLT